MQYIDKSALVEEIGRLDALYHISKGLSGDLFIQGLFCFINTLEVKEVDLETAFVATIDHFDEKNNYGQWPESDLRDFAKHFFELGLKAQKGE